MVITISEISDKQNRNGGGGGEGGEGESELEVSGGGGWGDELESTLCLLSLKKSRRSLRKFPDIPF